MSPAAARSTFTPSVTEIVPPPSTSQRASVQLLPRPAAARNVCTPSVTVIAAAAVGVAALVRGEHRQGDREREQHQHRIVWASS